jgi:hypothetical protein
MLRVCCACSPLCLSCLSDSTEKRRLPPLMFSLASEHSVSAPPVLGDRVANPCADEEAMTQAGRNSSRRSTPF